MIDEIFYVSQLDSIVYIDSLCLVDASSVFLFSSILFYCGYGSCKLDSSL